MALIDRGEERLIGCVELLGGATGDGGATDIMTLFVFPVCVLVVEITEPAAKVSLAAQVFVCGEEPILCENFLKLVKGSPSDSDGHVVPSKVLLANVDAPDEPHLTIDGEDLAVVSKVERWYTSEQTQGKEGTDVATGLNQRLEKPARQGAGAEAIVEDANLDACLGAFGEQIAHLDAHFIGLPDIKEDVDVMLCGANGVVEGGIGGRRVDEQRGGVARARWKDLVLEDHRDAFEEGERGVGFVRGGVFGERLFDELGEFLISFDLSASFEAQVGAAKDPPEDQCHRW